jgi:putative Holliday junction resolvase
MAKMLGIDFGLKRTGLAMTDAANIIASPLEYVESSELMGRLIALVEKEKISVIVLGLPMNLNNTPTDITANIYLLKEALEKQFPSVLVDLQDERFSSSIAINAMIQGGTKKSKRQEKGIIDKVSASVILQSYLDRKR